MTKSKITEIKNFFTTNSNPEIRKKYQRYFKEDYDGYGIDDALFRTQIEQWLEQWKNEMTIDSFLTLGDELMKHGKFEEKNLAISFLKAHQSEFSKDTFLRIANWFIYGINNWATTDVLCMLVLSDLLYRKIISYDDLKTWIDAESEWQRRAVPVSLVELDKLTKSLKPQETIEIIEPLMLDSSEYVQKGIGTLLRGLWKKYPSEIEHFLMKWKDQCGRIIVQYSTEKMDKEYRKKFRRSN